MSMNSGSSLFGAPPPLITQFPPPPLLNQPQSPLFQKGGNTTLIVRKIPKELNVEEKMREHFERFGRLVHVEVNYGGASDSALVRFSAPKEAHAAYKCPQPVFNNRFIRLYWFNGPNVNVGQTSKRPIGMMEPVGAVLSPKSDEPSLKRHVRERLEFMGAAPMVQAALKHDILISKENKIQDEAQLMDAGGAEKTGVTPGEKMQQAAVERKENQAMQSENLKKALLLKMELREKTQKLIEEQLKQQKILFQKFEETKSPEERSSILTMIKKINELINNEKETLEKQNAEILSKKNLLKRNSGTFAAGKVMNSKRLVNKPGAEGETPVASAPAKPLPPAAYTLVNNKKQSMFFLQQSVAAASLDHRPRKLLISNVESADEKISIVKHLRNFGAIESMEDVDGSSDIVIKFLTRKDAEMALVKGSVYKNKPLSISWFKEADDKQQKSKTTVIKSEAIKAQGHEVISETTVEVKEAAVAKEKDEIKRENFEATDDQVFNEDTEQIFSNDFVSKAEVEEKKEDLKANITTNEEEEDDESKPRPWRN